MTDNLPPIYAPEGDPIRRVLDRLRRTVRGWNFSRFAWEALAEKIGRDHGIKVARPAAKRMGRPRAVARPDGRP